MASNTMNVAALGRPFTLGMLYDAREDKLIPGLTLWDDKTLQDNTVENFQPFSAFDISASDTIESKSSLLDIDASLKASFMGGLIEVGGSAKYLNDTKKFHNQSRVTLQYKATTNFKQLTVTTLETTPTRQIDVTKIGSATHVVTGILYGANAFFLFDSEKLDAGNVQEIQGSMEAVIKKIPSFSVEGKVDIKLSDEEKELTNKFSCKFYGDFILESNPATFEDAVKTYAELPKLLGEKGENSVPVKVWLMPLKNLHSEAVELMSGISAGLVGKVQDNLEDLRELKMRCNDSLHHRVAKNFPHIRKELSRFQKLCDYYESNLKQTMATKVPLIRAGKENEISAERLLEVGNAPPFSYEKLSKWLDHKEREINVIRSCVDMMEGTKIVPNQSELDREVLAAGVEDALCFVFTSLESADICPDAIANLDSDKSGSTNEDLWYYSDEVLIKMRENAGSFQDTVKALRHNSRFSFLIAAIANKKYTGATIYHYKNGRLLTDDFSKPNITRVEEVTDRGDLIWYACELTLDPDTAHPNLILSKGNKKVETGERQPYQDGPERFECFQQVLCKEGLNGCHYWEVEWSGSARAAVTYIGIMRKSSAAECSLGYNRISWAFEYSGGGYCHIYNGKIVGSSVSTPGFKRLGVYLDWPAGTLSYYMVSSNKVSHLHTFYTRFQEVVYPGFLAGYNYPSASGQVKIV